MDIGRGKEELSVMEAVDNLSNMAEIDLKVPIDLDEEEISTEINWRDPKQALRNEDLVKETFRVLHRYLQNMVRRDRSTLRDPQIQKGIQAIMAIATEAVQKMDRFAALYPGQYNPISKLKEYTDLQKYYRQQILEQMPKPTETPEEWEENLEEELKGIEAEKLGLRDLEAVRKDQNYELFFIKNENNKPYFTRTLLRHIRLMGNFDELISKAEGEDPLLRLREMLDYELHEGAKEVLQLSAPYLDEFYKGGMKYKDRPYEGSLNKAIMALRMAANPKNLIENQSFKSCLEYYADFHRFLRQALKAPRYLKGVGGEMKDDPYTHAVLRLTHALCCYFFMRIEPRKEALKLIHRMMERGDEMRKGREKVKAEKKELQIWADLLDEDENLRYLAAHYPNGPLLRTLDMFREEEEYEGYDPLMHYNFPAQLFAFTGEDFHVTVMRIPSPVKQVYIQQAEIVEEFEGFIRFLKRELKPDSHLLVNLQDRTSWQGVARARAIDELAVESEYYETFYTLGLAKKTPFYSQSDEYQTVGGAPVFLELFEEQILSGADCGFHLVDSIEKKEIAKFLKPGLKLVHECFFEGKTTLTRLERISFIEIFYVLFVLKIIEMTGVDSVSFTCKDAIDAGMQQTAVFYGFLRLMNSTKAWSEEEKKQLLWILYSPALLIRERPIHQADFRRTCIVLETIHSQCLKKHAEIIKQLNTFFSKLKFPLQIKREKSN